MVLSTLPTPKHISSYTQESGWRNTTGFPFLSLPATLTLPLFSEVLLSLYLPFIFKDY